MEQQAKMKQEWRDVKTGDNFPLVLPLDMPDGTRFLLATETDGKGHFRIKNAEKFKRLHDLGGK
ncbi:MAG TPA: hypothetical protein P5540_19825 [Candidatus Hydrogenedentes bacterium]|nr:hypothetical protein [Candidatus Hydrogenedentota bacterium]